MLFTFNLHPYLLIGSAQEDTQEYATFSWSQTTYSTSVGKIWDGDSEKVNFTGSFSDVFTITDHYINNSDSTYMEETRIIDYNANYSYSTNYTFKGTLDLDIDIDVFIVNVDYGSGAKLVWMALKKGFYAIDYYRELRGDSYEYNETNHQIIEREIKKYDRNTGELLGTWNKTEEVYDNVNYTYHKPLKLLDDHIRFNKTFTMPLFLVFQIYTTEKGDHIAWASTFSEFLVYWDRDSDGIYSVGDYNRPPPGSLGIYSGIEHCGAFTPEAYEYSEIREGKIANYTSSGSLPVDKSVNEISSSIRFTPPSLNGGDTVMWDIDYRDFPTKASVTHPDIPFEEYVFPGSNPLYADLSPGDYSYGFNYKIGSGQADLSYTLEIPKMSGMKLYNLLQKYDLSLAIPQYNFFLSSFDINEKNPKELTLPCEGFMFESNNETVAEINLINPLKQNYTLYDYPDTGKTTSVNSIGASINKIVILTGRFGGNLDKPYMNFLDTIESYTDFSITDNLYLIHTENYPVWAGEKLVHDPTNTIYFKNITLPFKVATDLIPGFNVVILFGSISLAVLVITLELRKFKKK